MMKLINYQIKILLMIGKYFFSNQIKIILFISRPPTEVPSYAHLLNHSKLSSDSDTPKKKSSSNEKNTSKRLITSSPNSDGTPIKKKSKAPIRRRVSISSLSSSSDENDLVLLI